MTILPELEEPMGLVKRWLDEAIDRGGRPNPNAMTLATVADTGRPSARVVLVKGLDTEHGYAEFYTNYASRKATELRANHWAAGVLHWDALGRQIRFEGPVVKAPAGDSDAYFARRPWRSQINAWASRQSAVVEDPADLERAARELARRFGTPDPFSGEEPEPAAIVPRPAFWGGFRMWLAAVELWASGRDRFHERLRFERQLDRHGTRDFVATPWQSRRLQP